MKSTPTPSDQESLRGHLLRVAAANQVSPQDVLRTAGLAPERRLQHEDAIQLQQVTCADGRWLWDRIPSVPTGGSKVQWMGRDWRRPAPLFTRHAPACPPCVHEFGIARLEWDLTFYGACPIHRVPLMAHCAHCRRLLTWQRPAVDVCRCRRHLASLPAEAPSDLLLEWLAWVAQSLEDEEDVGLPLRLSHLFPGHVSIDGSWRVIHAFGVIPDAPDESLVVPQADWRFAARGLVRLRGAAEGRIAPQTIHRNALRRQVLRGATPGDRRLAQHYLALLGETGDASRRRRRSVQLELFER